MEYSSIETHGKVPEHRMSAGVVYAEKLRKVILCGGSSTKTVKESFSIVDTFEPNTMTWDRPRVKGKPPRAFISQGTCMMRNYLYLFGGKGLSNRAIYALNCNDRTIVWSRPIFPTSYLIPRVRTSHSMVAVGDSLVIVGGYNDKGKYDSDIKMFNTCENERSAVTRPNGPCREARANTF